MHSLDVNEFVNKKLRCCHKDEGRIFMHTTRHFALHCGAPLMERFVHIFLSMRFMAIMVTTPSAEGVNDNGMTMTDSQFFIQILSRICPC